MAQRGRPKKNAPTINIVKKSNGLTVTKEQIKKLREIEEQLTDIRRMLSHFDDHESIAKMAFCAGQAFYLVNNAEDAMCEVLEEITDEPKYEFNELGQV
jgi:hypothetical protein